MKTNYERLHEMSIEEMAQHLAREQFAACVSFIKGLDEELLPDFIDEFKKTLPEIIQEKLNWLNQVSMK